MLDETRHQEETAVMPCPSPTNYQQDCELSDLISILIGSTDKENITALRQTIENKIVRQVWMRKSIWQKFMLLNLKTWKKQDETSHPNQKYSLLFNHLISQNGVRSGISE